MKREKCLFIATFFQAAVIRTCSLYRMKKKNLWLQPKKRRVSLAWKPNWMPCHQVLKLWLTNLTLALALDQLRHRIQTSKKTFCRRKTSTCTPQQKVSSVTRTKRLIFPYEDLFKDCEDCGPKVHDGVAKRIDNACTKNPAKKQFSKIQAKYLRQENCEYLKGPWLTPSYGPTFWTKFKVVIFVFEPSKRV